MDKDLVVSGQNFDDILAIVSNARLRAAQAVNTELINMYWEIGSYVSKRVKNMSWVRSVVAYFSAFLQRQDPSCKGFSAQNIWRMKQFYETYCHNEKLSLLVREISWSNNLLIMVGCKNDQVREF